MNGAYAYFCDDMGLKRIDASPEQHLQNLDQMATELLRLRVEYLDAIVKRCPACDGSGRRLTPR